jgi:hypothetical protein
MTGLVKTTTAMALCTKWKSSAPQVELPGKIAMASAPSWDNIPSVWLHQNCLLTPLATFPQIFPEKHSRQEDLVLCVW